ncbi:MAG: signal recognition particle-docking protein FtsY [Chloroflexota bacterium]
MAGQKEHWKSGLEKTRQSTFGKIANFLGVSEINDALWDELEGLLIQADIGISTTQGLLAKLKEDSHQNGWTKSEELKIKLQLELEILLPSSPDFIFNPEGPTVILIVGVNGSGKTTTAAKLGKLFQDDGKSVLLVAADTFRAAAIEQLQSWGKKLGLRVISGQMQGDPGAITYDAVQSAKAKNEDVVIIDTAGRLHTKINLMEELKKVYNVAAKSLGQTPQAVWLVLDATTGQNALQQAKAFKESVQVTGVILSKLDSSARGGMAFAIQKELGLPILFAGLGEGADDLLPFNSQEFTRNILADFA